MGNNHNHVTYLDIDQYLESNTFLDQKALILDQGQYKTSWQSLSLGPYTLIDISTSCSMLYEGESVEGNYMFTFMTGEKNYAKINGVTLSKKSVFFIQPKQQYISACSDKFSALQLCVSVEELVSVIGEDMVELITKEGECLRQGRFLLNNYQWFTKEVSQLIKGTLTNVHALSDTTCFDIKERITEQLNLVFSADHVPCEQEHSNFKSRLAVVRRARDYLEAQNNAQIAIKDLAANSYCSLRTLEYSFNEVLAISPRNYLKLKRLQQIKQTLMSDNPISVAYVLKYFGVVNMGRFSQDYFKVFGEYPKDTLKKTRKGYFK